MRKKVFQHAGALIIAAIILTFFTMSWAMYNNTAEQLRVSVRMNVSITGIFWTRWVMTVWINRPARLRQAGLP